MHRRTNNHRWRGVCTLALAAFGVGPAAARAQTITLAHWLSPTSGSWVDPTRWSTDPLYPNIENVPGVVYDAIVAVTGADYTIALSDPVAARALKLSSPTATVHQTAAAFRVFELTLGAQGGGGRYLLDGGTLSVENLIIAPFQSTGGTCSFHQRGGWVNGATRTLVANGGTGTLTVDGAASRYVVPPNFSHPQPDANNPHHVGLGDTGVGTMILRNGASVTLGRVEVGGALGHGTLLIDGGAQVTSGSMLVGQSQDYIAGGSNNVSWGDGTIVMSGTETRLTLSNWKFQIGSVPQFGNPNTGGSGHFILNGGTLTVKGGSVIPPGTNQLFTLAEHGTLEINGGVLENQRTAGGGGLIISGGTLIQNGGHVNDRGLRMHGAGGAVRINGGSMAVNLIDVSRGSYQQTGGSVTTAMLTVGSITTPTIAMNISAGSFNAGTYLHVGGTTTIAAQAQVAVNNSVQLTRGTIAFNGGALAVNGTLSISNEGRFETSAGRDKVVRAGSLLISGPSAQLDLNDNSMILDSGATQPIEPVAAMLQTGYDNGSWSGPGIASSAAQVNSNHGVGIAPAASLFTSFPALFAGVEVDQHAILLTYTRLGDANLDDVVNLQDFNRLAANFGSTGAFWFRGDFNYDGNVNLADFNLLAANFGQSAAGPEVTPQDWAALGAAVPEPAAGMVVGTLVPALAGRRRRGLVRS